VLLKPDFTVKVADFGLSQMFVDDEELFQSADETYFQNYGRSRKYSMVSNSSAPEALRCGRCTMYSEYWAFGVTLWELFTLATEVPYSAECGDLRTANDILDYLASGQRLKIPEKLTPPKM
jgi:serine/threonine protein kinase